MNEVRERVLLDVGDALRNYPIWEHRDLIAFCIGAECFLDWEETIRAADFNEVIAVVDKDWLFEYMGMDNPRGYLQDEYTSEDSINWFDEAARTAHLAMIAFD